MDYLDQHKIAYQKVEVRGDPAQMKNLINVSGQSRTPTLLWEGEVLADFGTEELQAFLAERQRQ